MNLFIGCSMNDKIDEKIKKTSKKLFDEIFKNNDLVFGACDSGLMGEAYKSALKNKRNIIGISPERYKDDFKNINCNKEIVTSDVSNNMDQIIKESDCLLFINGGYGTMCEFFSSIERKRAGEFDKKIILFNDLNNPYFNLLLDFLKKMKEEGFSTEEQEEHYVVLNTIKEVMNYID